MVPYASASPVYSCISLEISSTRSRCLMALLYWPCRRADAARPRMARLSCTLSPSALDSMSAFSNRTMAAAPFFSLSRRLPARSESLHCTCSALISSSSMDSSVVDTLCLAAGCGCGAAGTTGLTMGRGGAVSVAVAVAPDPFMDASELTGGTYVRPGAYTVPARACCLSDRLILRSCSFRRSSSSLRWRAVMPPTSAPTSATNSVMPTMSTPKGVAHSLPSEVSRVCSSSSSFSLSRRARASPSFSCLSRYRRSSSSASTPLAPVCTRKGSAWALPAASRDAPRIPASIARLFVLPSCCSWAWTTTDLLGRDLMPCAGWNG
mmetsp:Transcript_29233/g.74551  ORF Transcript_29233/g.74551 Transcript_29233/m.74551 type:complete len:322 (+) Transcript_29233:430-1395(+)